MTRVIHIDRNSYSKDDLYYAVEALKHGGTVVFPTETVYGLGANAMNDEACKKIFIAKGRPSDNPLIVHISDMDQLENFSKNVKEEYKAILKELWPGPLTVVVEKANGIPDTVTAKLPTVAIRMPDDSIARNLIDMAGPIAAPSANISTKPSITDSKDAIRFLDGRVDVIIDAGKVKFGIESTIIDLTQDPVRLLRPGAFSVEDLEPLFGKITVDKVALGKAEAKVAITPGMKYRHYSPNKKIFLCKDREVVESLKEELPNNGVLMCTEEVSQGISTNKIIVGRDSDLYSVAHNLFSSFIELDDSSYNYGVIIPFEEKGIGLAIMNRIRKASTAVISSSEELKEYLDEYGISDNTKEIKDKT
ncbi:hypothetical protein [Thermoplasma volcanium GSS1]|uniref:Threonylcarbamoyl-AMP synthase n=1 Tax=Thermoplasma volcanium (strain ATCC 51530 / DSM 4299 / JCM 9571 / NBRC 15438 / GSS1) TaxID=273116 RepID=Q978U4_THEVO|nr:L-threonylcarbamoyladenylate synthase [Thermoplasma volcanium]BAB60463.1 hypothetical protein [Thermoplasma volcanium GSS1]